MAKLLKWRGRQIAARPRQILGAYGPVIGEELQEQIKTIQFKWPKNTLRFESKFMGGEPGKNGGVIVKAGPRDAVDTGYLMDSQQAAQITGGRGTLLFNIKWTAPYSGYVLRGGDYGVFPKQPYVNPEGAVVQLGERPGRDWISPALIKRPLRPFFFEQWRKRYGT